MLRHALTTLSDCLSESPLSGAAANFTKKEPFLHNEMPKDNKRLFLSIAAIIAALLLGWHLFSPFGLLQYFHLQEELAAVRTENEYLAKRNKELAAELDRFKNDDAFFSEIARKQHGMIKKNEVIFDFSKKP